MRAAAGISRRRFLVLQSPAWGLVRRGAPMRPKLLSLLIFFSVLVLAAVPAEARRVALIIGNNNYSALSKLINPVPDAKAIASVLKAHGFEVFEHYDITRADLL